MNIGRFKAKSKVRSAAFMELQYAGDNGIGANSPEDLQDILNAFAKAYRAQVRVTAVASPCANDLT
ncbi:hypothetical protein JOB18_042221 [Solea senegalensis]|uniref:Uncharacterized protein n=1 Tax=Solea senegalensis TaxID=28829 RepID=A0AAV6QKV0_SOLSE|nr:hypothetical protein JOB18_042221 [Solea senegalensis]